MTAVSEHSVTVGDRREIRRRARRGALLGAAQRIVARAGVADLTMQAVADRVGCSVGTVYTHFPSKGALVAELQNEAVHRLVASLQAVRARAHAHYEAGGRSASERAAADLVLFGEFFIAAWDAFPEESHLLFAVLAEREQVVPTDDLGRVFGSTMVLLAMGHDAARDAVEAEVVDPGADMDRVIIAASSMLGVLLTSHLAHIDAGVFDHRRLTRLMWHDLLRGWGMDAADLDAAWKEIEALGASGPLAPAVDD